MGVGIGVRSKAVLRCIHTPLEIGRGAGLGWCPIEGKLSMREEFIPPFHILLHNHPKQGAQSPVGHFSLGMTSFVILEMSPHLLPQGKLKVT